MRKPMAGKNTEKEADERRDAILKRMLSTPPKPHAPAGARKTVQKGRGAKSRS
jgi:hypothetical protein